MIHASEKDSEKGQASTEYLFVCTALVLALSIGLSNPDSVLWKWIHALQTAYQKFSFALSLPL